MDISIVKNGERYWQCMALNRDMTDRCHRKATKQLAPLPRDGEEPSIRTVRLCGFCNRSLHGGSRSLCLKLSDGTLHTVCAGRGIGQIWVTKDRGDA